MSGWSKWHGPQAMAQIRDAAARAQEIEIGRIRKEALAGTPVDTGQLRRSQEVTHDAAALYGEIVYHAPYAIYVHEILKNYRIGSWKYLENPVRNGAQAYFDTIASALNQVLS